MRKRKSDKTYDESHKKKIGKDEERSEVDLPTVKYRVTALSRAYNRGVVYEVDYHIVMPHLTCILYTIQYPAYRYILIHLSYPGP